MNPSSFNQNFRRYSQDTCDLMIEDKKSPFPTWMNFNKPNPLKFSLGLTDPDRPEQAPVRITGDRSKLESLHQAVESYVGKLLSKTPLPQLNIDQPNSPSIAPPKPPAPGNFNLKVGDGSIKIKMGDAPINTDRPIDALNLTGDQPYLEPDGLSRHLLYLGNIATDNQVMVSLNTLQLFDLASTLAEGLAPISSAVTGEMTDFGAAVVPPMIGEEATVEVVQPDITPAVTNRFANSVTEPRVVKSVEQSNNSNPEEFSSTGAASSLLRVKKSSERFKVPNITFNKSRFTSSPDSSLSPLSTYWPWLGVGTVAAGIIAATLLGGNGKDGSLSSKPTVNPTTMAKASTSATEFQPAPIPTPSALEGSTTPTPTVSSSQPVGAPGSGTVLVSPSLPTPIAPGAQVPGRSTAGVSSATPNGSNMGLGSNSFGSSGLPATGRGNVSKTSGGKAPIVRSSQPLDGKAIFPTRLPGSVPQGVPVDSGVGGSGFSMEQMAGSSDSPFGSGVDTAKPTRQNGKAVKPSKTAKRPAAPANISDSLPGSVAAGDDLFAPADSKNSDSPVKQLPVDNNPNPLDAPAANSVGTTQATETQSYFQKRWKADPNFSETLQYVIRLDKSGKVVQVSPQGDVSKNYLDKTNFLRSGEKVVSPNRTGKDQDVRVLLKPNGEVETIVEP